MAVYPAVTVLVESHPVTSGTDWNSEYLHMEHPVYKTNITTYNSFNLLIEVNRKDRLQIDFIP